MFLRFVFAILLMISVIILGWNHWEELQPILEKYYLQLGGIGSVASILGLTIPLFFWVFRAKNKSNKQKIDFQQEQVKQGREYLDSLLLDNNLTNLVPIQQLEEARVQFNRALNSNDAQRAQKLMQEYLKLARAGYGSTDTYDEILSNCRVSYRELLDRIERLPNTGKI